MKTLQEILKEIVTESDQDFKAFKKARTDTYTSKMWIDDKGELINLGSRHAPYFEMRAKADKSIKRKKSRTGEDSRLDALDAGWFRVNYEFNGDRLVIEGLEKHFRRHIKDAIFMLVAENLSTLRIIEIHLLNEKYNTIKNGTVDLSRFSKNEKLDHIPLISESVEPYRKRLGL